MSRGGLPASDVIRFASIVPSVIPSIGAPAARVLSTVVRMAVAISSRDV